MEGFVKLSRNIMKWGWYNDNNTLAVYIRLLLEAAWCDTEYENVILKRGQVASTYPKIAKESGLTERQARSAIERLKQSGKIEVKVTSKFSIITLLEYDSKTENVGQNVSQISGRSQPTCQSDVSPSLFKKENNNKRKQENTALTRGEGVCFENKSFENNSDNSVKSSLEASFERFWSSYPKKIAKPNALAEWEKLKPNEELLQKMLTALESFKKTEQWQKENGRFIPHPATWLKNRRWEDSIEPYQQYQNRQYQNQNSTEHRSTSYDIEDIERRIRARYQNS